MCHRVPGCPAPVVLCVKVVTTTPTSPLASCDSNSMVGDATLADFFAWVIEAGLHKQQNGHVFPLRFGQGLSTSSPAFLPTMPHCRGLENWPRGDLRVCKPNKQPCHWAEARIHVVAVDFHSISVIFIGMAAALPVTKTNVDVLWIAIDIPVLRISWKQNILVFRAELGHIGGTAHEHHLDEEHDPALKHLLIAQ